MYIPENSNQQVAFSPGEHIRFIDDSQVYTITQTMISAGGVDDTVTIGYVAQKRGEPAQNNLVYFNSDANFVKVTY